MLRYNISGLVLVCGNGRQESGQSEHSFAKEDVHWGPGANASAYTGEEKGEGVTISLFRGHIVGECSRFKVLHGEVRGENNNQLLAAVGCVLTGSGEFFGLWGWRPRWMFTPTWW